MRRLLTLLHRWLGLASALFLFIAGATGALISWDHELDALLNPAFYRAAAPAARGLGPEAALALAERLERADPRLQVSWLPLSAASDEALLLEVAARRDPRTDRAHALGFNQVALAPLDGTIQARREWGRISLARQDLLPFLYKLHYSLHIPRAFDIEWGLWLMGVIAMVWVVDGCVALYVAFPSRKRWRNSLRFRFGAGVHKLTFDLHRSGGVWVWALLSVLAVSAVSMNLREQVVEPVVSLFSTLTPSPLDGPPSSTLDQPLCAAVSRAAVLERALREAARRGWDEPAGAIRYDCQRDVYAVGFFAPGDAHGDLGLGHRYLYYRGSDGAALGALVPGAGSAGDIFLQAQYPLHSGRLFGLVGRCVVSFLGALVALLSVTGVLIWARRQVRVAARAPRSEAQAVRSGTACK